MTTPLPATALCDDDCPIRRADRILGGKWTTLIFRELFGGTKRYSELQRALTGISPRILADRLQMLQAEGLVTRRLIPDVPPKTEYSLTPKGQNVEGVLAAMAAFGESLKADPAR